MEQLNKMDSYRQILRQVVEYHASLKPGNRKIDSIAVCDPRNDNYLMMDIGYDHLGRVDEVIIHLRLREDGRVLIEYDGIEYGIARDLIKAGIPPEDILLNMYATPQPLPEKMAA
ncbi:MAG: element excision factor XisI family protein [Blastocatellia bacterium]